MNGESKTNISIGVVFLRVAVSTGPKPDGGVSVVGGGQIHRAHHLLVERGKELRACSCMGRFVSAASECRRKNNSTNPASGAPSA